MLIPAANRMTHFARSCPPCTVIALAAVLLMLLAGCTAMPIQPVSEGTVPGAVATEAPAEEAAATAAPAEESAATGPASGPASVAAIAVPAGEPEEYNGMTVGFTQEGYAYRGDPNAPVVMFEFSDFQCPYCARYFVQTEPALNESYVKPGTLRVVFRDMPLADLHPAAPAAHEAAACAAEQGAALFWAMHDQIFRTQTVWGNLGDPSAEFANLAETIGADMDAYNACIAAGEKPALVEERLNEALSLGFNGTPSFIFATPALTETFTLVGAQPFELFAQTIDSLAAGEAPTSAEAAPDPSAAQGQQEGIPAWASPEGKAVDPNNPGFTMYGDQTRGDADAPIVIVEFSDFQCPYCLRHHTDTQPALDSNYVDTGKVRFIFKHFPLAMHPQAPAAGVAAECASDQGQFWEMYDLLFETVDAWSVADPSPVFVDLAAQLGLDTDAFSACLADPAVAQRVAADQADGAQFVQGTPTFILLYGDGGRIIPGALPLETFAAELDSILTEVGG